MLEGDPGEDGAAVGLAMGLTAAPRPGGEPAGTVPALHA